jgi:2'-5' RNA ligase
MRLFTAIDIPDELRERLRELLARWKPLARIHWSPVANLHITTKFIGEWPEARVEEIKIALHAMAPMGAFDISVHGMGWFPDNRRPRVLWAGIEGGEALGKLAHATEQAVAALGVPVEERVYSPHLTLARIREAVPLNALIGAVSHARESAADFGAFRATEFFLYLSAGGKYTRMEAFSL